MLYGFGCQQCMVQTTQAHAGHQYHRKIKNLCQIRASLPLIDRHQKSAGTFDNDDIRFRAEFEISLMNHRQVNCHACLLCGDMRCKRWVEGIGIDLLTGNRHIAGCQQVLHIHPFPVFTPRRNRFHTNNGFPLCGKSMQQCAAHMGFADAGIRSGDKKAYAHLSAD